MKINSVHIISFGKIKNLRLDFTDNLNIIYGDNEAGKTHIAEFIKVMFYGSGSRGQGVNNLRKRYKPWDNTKMGGAIEFTHQNTRYRLEREFKASNSADTIVLHNLDLGTCQTVSGSENLGAKLFGISVGAFEQSVFIDNSVVFSSSDDGELNLKLANLSNSTDEDISFDKIIKNISSATETLISKNRKNGPVPELYAEIEQLKAERQRAIAIYKEADEKNLELLGLEERLQRASKEKAEIFEQLKAFELKSLREKLTDFKKAAEIYEGIEQNLKLTNGETANQDFANEIAEKLQDLKIKLASNNEKQNKVEADTEEIAKLSQALPEKDAVLTALNDKKEEYKNKLKATEEALSSAYTKFALLENDKAAQKGRPDFILIIIGAILTVLGIVAIPILKPFVSIPLMALGIIGIILGFILKKKVHSSKTDSCAEIQQIIESLRLEKEDLAAKISETDTDINNLLIRSGADNSLIMSKKEQLLKERTELILTLEDFERERSKVFARLSAFKPVFDMESAEKVLSELQELLKQLNDAAIRAQMSVAHTGCRTTKEALEKLDSIPDNLPIITDTREELNEKFNNSGKVCSDLSKKIAELSSELRSLTNGIPNESEFTRKITECEEKLSSMEEFLSSAKIAADTLNEAYIEQRRSWGGVLESRALKIFAGLTENTYNDMIISKDFEISVKKEDDITSHAAEYLSKGTLHQAYFALRLALTEFLCQDFEPLPIILDDVFSQYDNKRTAAGFKFLNEYSKNNQVLFFTCHKELSRFNSGNIIEL